MQCNKSFGLTVIHRRTNWIELYIYTIATDTNGMLPALIRTLMIATVLACPALGGRCCDAGHSDVAAGTLTVNGCETCCCHDSDLPSPACPAEGGECHDCFCAGGCRWAECFGLAFVRFALVRFRCPHAGFDAGLFASGVCSARCLSMAADDGRAFGHSLHAADLAADFPTHLTSGSSSRGRIGMRIASFSAGHARMAGRRGKHLPITWTGPKTRSSLQCL